MVFVAHIFCCCYPVAKDFLESTNRIRDIGSWIYCQGAFHVVNREDLRREIELLLGVAAYSLRPWRGGATLFCFTRRKCGRDGVIYNYYK